MNSIKININKREFNCVLGLYFIGEAIEALDTDYESLLEKYGKNPFKYIPRLMYESIKADSVLNGSKIDFEYKDLLMWIEEDGGFTNKELIRWSHAFIESLSKDVPKEEEKPKEAKDAKKK